MPSLGRLSALFLDADQPRAPDAEVEWYASRLPRDAGPVLEAMSGWGRLLVPLAARRINVHGVDASPAMIACCEVRLAAAGLSTPLFRQDIAALNLPFRYGAAVLSAGHFQRLTDPLAAQKALARIRAHLVAPSLLLMDLFVPAEATHPPGAPEVQVQTVTLPDGTKIARRAEIFVDSEAKRIEVRSRYEQRERATITAREDDTAGLTWYGEDEIAELLREAGYRDVSVGPPARPLDERTPAGEKRSSVTAAA